MLFLGMGTEVCVFFISAFDRPFDKTQIGKDLPTHLEEPEGAENAVEGAEAPAEVVAGNVAAGGTAVPNGVVGGGTIIIGGGGGGSASPYAPSEGEEVPQTEPSSGNVAAAVNNAAWVSQQQQVSPEMAEATSNYVDELNKLTEMLGKVSDQSARLTRDSEEMENLNRTLTGICKVYEMQLKGASQQIGTIDSINDQSRKMAQQIEQLNKIYARMIEAMTVNMRAANPGAPTTPGENI
jgi:archaellum component FlaC